MPDYYLITQILLSLAVAALIGFLVGYWLRSIFGQARIREIERNFSAKVDAANSKVQSLTSAHEEAETRATSLESAIKSLRERSAVAGTAGSTEEASLLRGELQKAEARITKLSAGDGYTDVERDLKWKDAQIRWRDQQILALREEALTAPAGVAAPADAVPVPVEAQADVGTKPAGLLSSVSEGEPDDLKKIWGIGPVMERILNEHGIYYYRQIAELSGEEITWVAARIDTFPDRIARDRWLEQAADLHQKKHGFQGHKLV